MNLYKIFLFLEINRAKTNTHLLSNGIIDIYKVLPGEHKINVMSYQSKLNESHMHLL